ncbi:aromatic amino acid DMT transporter YddG [Paracidovorax konjaci]|uniref:EamA-like transporter family protein n=1 Tax=Paracidovorax konjaci TaxID=32040 RepID=A0A1I1S8T4_9BURK|nr:aromatic amino acid DMT transporter YddG [Paracidovorax konjaci]SFD39410.1 EamA-like transporter family protein [Paracidovorax konjaci]
MQTKNRATLIGLIAIALWSSIVGLIRSVSEGLGATGGAAMIYTIASLLLWATVGFTPLRSFPRRYLAWGSLLFVSYELCLALSIGYAASARQAIEVGMVNYLWPTFTMVAAIAFNGQKANLLVVPGLAISLAGICTVLGGGRGVDLPGMLANVQSNPLSYGLAFTGAVIWAAYCTVTARIAGGKNGITMFFMLTALVLWAKYLATGAADMDWSLPTAVSLAFAAAAMGFGYAAWNVGILHGNVTLLAGASYFTPVLSAALAAVLLRVPLTTAFWAGAFMVCGGAILCWLATRGAPKAGSAEAAS